MIVADETERRIFAFGYAVNGYRAVYVIRRDFAENFSALVGKNQRHDGFTLLTVVIPFRTDDFFTGHKHRSVGVILAEVELQFGRLSDKFENRFRIVDVRNLDSETSLVLDGNDRFGITFTYKQGLKSVLRAFEFTLKIVRSVAVRVVNGVNAALQIETEFDGRRERLVIVKTER